MNIPLSQGHTAQVDSCDYDDLIQFKWYAHFGGAHWYACRTTRDFGKISREYMHRRIMGVTERKVIVDHVNRAETLDNRRDNLRLATQSENHINTKMRSDNTSGFRGVHWHKDRKKWRACICFYKKEIFLGYFDSKMEAAAAYNKAAIALYGAFVNEANNRKGIE